MNFPALMTPAIKPVASNPDTRSAPAPDHREPRTPSEIGISFSFQEAIIPGKPPPETLALRVRRRMSNTNTFDPAERCCHDVVQPTKMRFSRSFARRFIHDDLSCEIARQAVSKRDR